MLWKDLRSVLLGSVGIGVGITLGGLVLSFDYDLPSGPSIILLGAILLVGVYGAKRLRRSRPKLPLPDTVA
jgi:ABC-type Mn2+/Zn2+ transport system permease subunit